MKTICFIILGACLMSFELYPQSMKDIFMQLPADFSPSLNADGKKALIQSGQYIFQQNSTDANYTLDTVTNIYMEYEYSYGDGGSASFELKKFHRTNDGYFLVAVKNGVDNVSQSIPVISVFDLLGDKPNGTIDIPAISQLGIASFFKKDIPDNIASELMYSSAVSCDLDVDSQDKMTYNLSLANEDNEKYLAGDEIVLTWTGTKFTSEIKFKQQN